MYTGQIEIPPEQISSFVSTVLFLQIKGVVFESTTAPNQNKVVVNPAAGTNSFLDTGLTPPIVPEVVPAEQVGHNKDLTTLTVAAAEPEVAKVQENSALQAPEIPCYHENIDKAFEGDSDVAPTELTEPSSPTRVQYQETFERSLQNLHSIPKKTTANLDINGAAPRTKRQHKIPSYLKGFQLSNVPIRKYRKTAKRTLQRVMKTARPLQQFDGPKELQVERQPVELH